MPPVGHLPGVGCTLTGSVGVAAGAVPADHLDAGVDAQPVGELHGALPVQDVTGRFPSPRSTNTVPYSRPRRHANSSTPRTVTGPTGGSGRLRIPRSSVDRLTGMPSAVANLEPARPANASAIATNASCAPAVRWVCRWVRPGTCSTNVPAEQSS